MRVSTLLNETVLMFLAAHVFGSLRIIGIKIGDTTFSITTLRLMTLCITVKSVALGILENICFGM